MKRMLSLLIAMGLLNACQLTPLPGAPAASTVAAAGGLVVRITPSLQTQALEGIVARIHFDLSGPNLPATQSIDVTRDQFVNNRAVVQWSRLLPGTVRLVATLFDQDGHALGVAEGQTLIEDSKTAQLTLTVTPYTGSATLSLGVGDGLESTATMSLSVELAPPQTWQTTSPLAIARVGLSAVDVQGQVWVVGGDFNDEIELLDPASLRWVPRLVPNDTGLAHPLGQAAALRKIIVMVGNDREYLNAPEVASPIFIDPLALDSYVCWESSKGSMSQVQEPRAETGVTSEGEHLYMVGGSSRRKLDRGTADVYVTSAGLEKLSAQTEEWSVCAAMPTPRASLAAAMLDGKLYAAGGYQWTGQAATDPMLGVPGVAVSGASRLVLANLEQYDPVTDRWKACAPMPTPRYGLALVAAGSKLYALGGADATGKPLSVVETYDPATDRWLAIAPMPTPRALLAAVLVPGGPLLALGGVGLDGRPSRTVEAFNPEALK